MCVCVRVETFLHVRRGGAQIIRSAYHTRRKAVFKKPLKPVGTRAGSQNGSSTSSFLLLPLNRGAELQKINIFIPEIVFSFILKTQYSQTCYLISPALQSGFRTPDVNAVKNHQIVGSGFRKITQRT